MLMDTPALELLDNKHRSLHNQEGRDHSMPANLPPQYFEAEKAYRAAKTPQEKIKALENMLSIMPKHKGTDRLRGDLRRKIAKLTEQAQKKHLIGTKGALYYFKREGAGQGILVGMPNAGKSQLLAIVTSAAPEIADYPFSTKVPVQGMMGFENIKIQLVDVPPIVDESSHSWLHNVLRNSDLLVVVVDLTDDPLYQMETILRELEEFNIEPVDGHVEESEEHMIAKKIVVAANKWDMDGAQENLEYLRLQYGEQFPICAISAKRGDGLEELKQEIFKALDIIRVYTKTPGMKPDLADPVILEKGSTVEDFAAEVHKDFVNKLKYALIWGSGKFDGQRVSKQHVLQDGDVVELHI